MMPEDSADSQRKPSSQNFWKAKLILTTKSLRSCQTLSDGKLNLMLSKAENKQL